MMDDDANKPSPLSYEQLREIYVARFERQDAERVRKRFDKLYAAGKVEVSYSLDAGWWVGMK
jgi:hypothetical protein